MIELRDYQIECAEALFDGMQEQPTAVSVPTGGGKSLIIADATRKLLEAKKAKRVIIVVPSYELVEQNMRALDSVLPVGYSKIAYHGGIDLKKRKELHGLYELFNVVVCTTDILRPNDIKMLDKFDAVFVDECHQVNPKGGDTLNRFVNQHCSEFGDLMIGGLSATCFRGNNVTILEGGKDPMFKNIAYTVSYKSLIDKGFLAPLVTVAQLRELELITSDGLNKSSAGEYVQAEVEARTAPVLEQIADRACKLAVGRKSWIAFLPSVELADRFGELLLARGISSGVVVGDTPDKKRAGSIASFRSRELRCLVTVTALSVGFDAPNVDCILWMRNTTSPVLYVQGMGRGTRICEGKANCLVLDFTDTTRRFSPIDMIQGLKAPPPPVVVEGELIDPAVAEEDKEYKERDYSKGLYPYEQDVEAMRCGLYRLASPPVIEVRHKNGQNYLFARFNTAHGTDKKLMQCVFLNGWNVKSAINIINHDWGLIDRDLKIAKVDEALCVMQFDKDIGWTYYGDFNTDNWVPFLLKNLPKTYAVKILSEQLKSNGYREINFKFLTKTEYVDTLHKILKVA